MEIVNQIVNSVFYGVLCYVSWGNFNGTWCRDQEIFERNVHNSGSRGLGSPIPICRQSGKNLSFTTEEEFNSIGLDWFSQPYLECWKGLEAFDALIQVEIP